MSLVAYNDTIIKQYGVISIPCSYGKDFKYKSMDFYIVETKGPAILGLFTSVFLGQVSINAASLKT